MKRLSEIFLENYKNIEGITSYKEFANGKLIFARIINDSNGKSIILYDNSRYICDIEDTDNDCVLEMHVFEDKLSEEDGMKDMTELFDYYLSEETITCLCIKNNDKANEIDYEKVDYDDDSYDNTIVKIGRLLVKNNISTLDNFYDLAVAIEDALFNQKHIFIGSYELYYDDVPVKEVRGVL